MGNYFQFLWVLLFFISCQKETHAFINFSIISSNDAMMKKKLLELLQLEKHMKEAQLGIKMLLIFIKVPDSDF